MKKEVSNYLDWWLKDEIRGTIYTMSKSYNLNERLSEELGVTTSEVFDKWDSDLLKSLLELLK